MVLLAKLKELADRVLGEDQRAKHLREESCNSRRQHCSFMPR